MAVTYNPDEYWDQREHPNTDARPPVNPSDREHFEPVLNESRSVLEIGPGIGRLVPLYTKQERVVTLDLTDRYSSELSAAADEVGVSVEQKFRDKARDPFPFADNEFDLGILSHVLMHVPFDLIEHTMKEAARTCKKVAVMSVREDSWPKKGEKFDPAWHCFDHDYRQVCQEIGCNYSGFKQYTEKGFGFYFQ